MVCVRPIVSTTFVSISLNKLWIDRTVYTDQGKVRALIRAALNERALERYILTWLSDTNGLLLRYESWALVRDNEASNLLPSIAAGTQYEIYYIKHVLHFNIFLVIS